MFKKIKIFISIIFLLILQINLLKAEEDYNNKHSYQLHDNVSLEVISSVESINKKNLFLGLNFQLKPGWKIYWKYPGKAGYPPKINWANSKNIESLEILWPKPKKFKILGMDSIGYSDEVVLPIKLILKNNNQELLANFHIDYLTCKKICIPFTDNLILKIPIGDGKRSKHEKIINKYIDKSNYSTYSNIFNSDSILNFGWILHYCAKRSLRPSGGQN